MELKIRNIYNLTINKSIEKSFELNNLTEYLQECKNDYLDSNGEFTKNDLINLIDDFKYEITEHHEDIYDEKDDIYHIDTFSSEIMILNYDEILKHFSYLIYEPEVTCCSKQTGNYCSICGKKL